ncbi:hypothetical protein [Parabacteroides gordonii]|uniref:hypothetical protein n=1 Tax=Parabacteroides gordonii TaxID=574930 RepID=UPI0026F0D065|nr:hypothetical protein [Parabacteroides gordonii]
MKHAPVGADNMLASKQTACLLRSIRHACFGAYDMLASESIICSDRSRLSAESFLFLEIE